MCSVDQSTRRAVAESRRPAGIAQRSTAHNPQLYNNSVYVHMYINGRTGCSPVPTQADAAAYSVIQTAQPTRS